jgi:hypothetical protein
LWDIPSLSLLTDRYLSYWPALVGEEGERTPPSDGSLSFWVLGPLLISRFTGRVFCWSLCPREMLPFDKSIVSLYQTGES